MNCPVCNKRTRVFDTRPIEGGVARKRRCARRHECFTVERQIAVWLYKDARKGRKKLAPKPKLAPKATKTPPKTWLERIQSEAGKLFAGHLL